jgi:hypothetical protein
MENDYLSRNETKKRVVIYFFDLLKEREKEIKLTTEEYNRINKIYSRFQNKIIDYLEKSKDKEKINNDLNNLVNKIIEKTLKKRKNKNAME